MHKIIGFILIIITIVNGENIKDSDIVKPIIGTYGLYFDFISDVKFYKKNDVIKIVSFFDMDRYIKDVHKIADLSETLIPLKYNIAGGNVYGFLLQTAMAIGTENNKNGDEFLVKLYHGQTSLSTTSTAGIEELSASSLAEYDKEISQIRMNKISKPSIGVFYNDNFQHIFDENSTEYEDIKETISTLNTFHHPSYSPFMIDDDLFSDFESREFDSNNYQVVNEQIRTILTKWSETQNQIRSIFNTPYYDFISPKRMESIISVLKKDVPADLFIADGKRQLSFGIARPYFIFETRIPLVSKDNYKLYKVYPLPIPQPDGYLYIQPTMEYLAIDNDKIYTTELDLLHFQLCLKSLNSTINNYVCQFESDRHKILRLDYDKCEIDLLLGVSYEYSDCKVTKLKFRSYWTQLNDTNNWLFSSNKNILGQQVCQTSTRNITINDRGIVKIKDGCYIKTSEGKIVSKKFRESGPKFIGTNVSVFYYKDQRDYEHLQHAIDFHQKNERLHKTFDSNHIGHNSDKIFIYYLIFGLFILILGVGIFLIKMGYNLNRFRLNS